MTTTGNDNYRPGLEPPAPIKGGSGWLSSNMAQLMVFLNGLILTITAFATLSVFINEIVQDSLVQTAEDTKSYIVSEYEDIESQMLSLGTMMEMVETDKKSAYLDKNLKELDIIKSFDHMFWVIKDRDTGQWFFQELHGNSYGVNSEDLRRELLTMIKVSKIYETDDKLKFTTEITDDLKNAAAIKNEDAKNLFSMIQKIKAKDGNNEYIVVVSKFNSFFNDEWIRKRPLIDRVSIVDNDNQNTLFEFRKNGVNDNNIEKDVEWQTFFTAFSDTNITIKMEMSLSARESFLKKIPLLMLLFGITLTFIGTLYVRNNQRQSLRLAKMNKELAHKNFELNQEFSEKTKLSEAMEASEREHRSIINSVSDIIFETDARGTILFLNETWTKITGFELDRSIGRSVFDLIYIQDQDEQKQNFSELVKGQRSSYRSFTRLRTSEGTFRAVELAVSMIRHDKDNELRVVGTITDVEERRRAERALSEAEKKYRAIVENAASGIYQVTPEGQFLSANPAFSTILGYDLPEEVLRDIVNSNEQIYLDPTIRAKFLQQVSSAGVSKNLECQIKKKDDTIIWVSENVRPVKDDEGTLLYYEGSMEDVDQRKRAEIALREAKFESDLANRAKSEFLANMSHELRTPLNSIIGFSGIISEEAYGPIDQREYWEHAKNINESGNGLLNVINQILDVSRIDAGERQLNESSVDLPKVIDSCVSLLDAKISENNNTINNLIIDSSVKLVGETQAVKQMLMNLISNAVKFNQEGGVITLSQEIDSNGRLRISVTDTGSGLSEDEIQKALSPFGQVDSEMNRTGSGTGLGLTLVHSLISLHGGELEFVSQKGVGTTVTLVFPKNRVTAPMKKETAIDETISVEAEEMQARADEQAPVQTEDAEGTSIEAPIAEPKITEDS